MSCRSLRTGRSVACDPQGLLLCHAYAAYGVDCLLDTAIATLEKLRPGGGGSDSVRATM